MKDVKKVNEVRGNTDPHLVHTVEKNIPKFNKNFKSARGAAEVSAKLEGGRPIVNEV